MSRTAVLPAAIAVAALAPFAPAAARTGDTYTARTLTQPAAAGLPVTGPLSDYRAGVSARVVVPSAWRVQKSPAGTFRFTTTQNPSCHFTITYTVASSVSADRDAEARAVAALPVASPRYVLDSGRRGNAAFRVVRRPTNAGRIGVQALWTGVLTRRADIAPAGQTAWADLRVDATSRAGDECHSGTWREALGPAIGDSLAVARARLHFAKP